MVQSSKDVLSVSKSEESLSRRCSSSDKSKVSIVLYMTTADSSVNLTEPESAFRQSLRIMMQS